MYTNTHLFMQIIHGQTTQMQTQWQTGAHSPDSWNSIKQPSFITYKFMSCPGLAQPFLLQTLQTCVSYSHTQSYSMYVYIRCVTFLIMCIIVLLILDIALCLTDTRAPTLVMCTSLLICTLRSSESLPNQSESYRHTSVMSIVCVALFWKGSLYFLL